MDRATSRTEAQAPTSAFPKPPPIRETARAPRRFDPVQAGLPLALESQCLACENVLPALVSRRAGRVVLDKTCPGHATMEEFIGRDGEV